MHYQEIMSTPDNRALLSMRKQKNKADIAANLQTISDIDSTVANYTKLITAQKNVKVAIQRTNAQLQDETTAIDKWFTDNPLPPQ